ncbi:hypothetical protein [Vibrio owensii]|uniref:Uncharacterized protein n=1 Tax=Vibrio owensii CAIM 1854 = LMG 25443 TaxID=1229493 RepID=A0A0C1ZDB0_9VIBR|nr:hypothetical protein [Vibrio owensii]KIF51026.1 hypothetical protein H735_22275 [Vibrio owensii CAIM 1854 = LMG 25443]
MANHLIKITESHSQGVREESEQVWCALASMDTERTLCGDAVDSDNIIKAEFKVVKRGGITCPLCLSVVKQVKAIKL